MAKRRLSKQQKARIDDKHASTIDRNVKSAGKNATTPNDNNFGAAVDGLVISHFRAQADVECQTSGDVVRCHLRANLPHIVTGDRVIWRRGLGESASEGIVEAIEPRSSELCRPDSYGKMKLVGANVTRAIIVIAPEPEAHSNLIDRYIIVAEHLGLDVLLLLNKCDLLEKNSPTETLLKKYQALGYTTLSVSSKLGIAMEALQETLKAGCSIFVGQSGVGKSSVIQSLLPEETIKVGELSDVARKGRHTTTHAKLYHFPEGGNCIDSPGIREFGLWHLNPDDILYGFREFRPFIGQCKYRNCTHINDANCAISKATEDGKISAERYKSFTFIVQSLSEVTIQGEHPF
ncbi:MAG TPA: small ribosomal subunit biogenesis GTPase RsgA [Marinagarivorans sp.]